MFTKLKTFIYTLTASIMLLAPTVAVPLAAHAADIENGVCQGSNLQFSSNITGNACNSIAGNSENKVNSLVTTIINIFSVIVGIIAVIMIIVGGFRYITSGGNDQNVASAKNTILYAIIGLVIVALAQLVVKYVLKRVVESA